MYTNKFQMGDEVSYAGEKLAKELSGVLGVIHSRVSNTEREVVVVFGKDAYVLDETRHLTKFNGKRSSDGTAIPVVKDKKAGGPAVEKRKGIGAGKRRSADQDGG